MTVLKVDNITKIYEGKVSFKAINQVSFEIKKGEFTAIMGPSGSGKSTLLNLISTIDQPNSGSILFNGSNPYIMNDSELANFRRNKLGFIFQDFNLIETLTVWENIMLPLTLAEENVAKMKISSKKMASMLGIDQILDKRTYEISGGQAQRVAIARAVINNPELILADEPTGNLDSKSTKDVMKLLSLLNKKNNSTILMVTHDAFVASHCDRVLIIKDGRLYQEIISGKNKLEFQQKIIDSMCLLGGKESDTF